MAQQEPHPAVRLAEIARATRYPLDAFHFVRRGLDHTVTRIHKDPAKLSEQDRHVSGQQLCQGLRQFALEEYGHLAKMMLNRWNIYRTDDFGQIVFAMVNGGLMQATERDSIDDFVDGFDFDEGLCWSIPVDQVPLEDWAGESVEQAQEA
jgi:uncharacterized repeat protein (TIGR04138 family)